MELNLEHLGELDLTPKMYLNLGKTYIYTWNAYIYQ